MPESEMSRETEFQSFGTLTKKALSWFANDVVSDLI